ncbi:hypothetical protein MUP01_00035, partial [Candidatus Bathyarchaeota archaeon]|nr:hypothetical protein [Candidatus Bathyarchaeota archaeon]
MTAKDDVASGRNHSNSGRGEVSPSIVEMSPLDQHKPLFFCVFFVDASACQTILDIQNSPS